MKHRNVTLALPEDIAKKARHMAVASGMSLSRFVADMLEQRVSRSFDYDQARERQKVMMREGLGLGLGERATWSRNELHER